MPKNTPQRRIDTRRRNQATSISGVTLSGPAGVTDHGALQGLADDDHSQYLLADGTRQLVGNLSVADTVTVDGVDISAHAANADAHHPRSHEIVGGDHSASGLTTGWTIRATGAATFAWAQLQHGDLGGVSADQHHNQVHAITGADHTVSGAAWQIVGLTGTDTLGLLTPLASTLSTAEGVLKSDASGGLALRQLGIGTASPARKVHILDDTGAQMRLAYDASNYMDFLVDGGGSWRIAPTGDIIVDPTGDDMRPLRNYAIRLGLDTSKYLSLHVAELIADTFVAEDVRSTIGGKIFVAPTTQLTRDLAGSATTYDAVTQRGSTTSNGATGSGSSTIAQRGSATTATGTNLVTLDKPTGVVENDLMIVFITTFEALSFTPPSGWTLLYSNPAGTYSEQWCYYRIAGASEPSSYSWSLSGIDEIVGTMSAWYNVDTTTPIDAYLASDDTTAGTTQVADAITIVTDGALLLAVAGFNNDTAGGTTASTPPSGMTELSDAATTQWTWQSAAYQAGMATGTTGTRTFSLNQLVSESATALVALRPAAGGNTSVSVTKPTGVVDGDVMVATVAFAGGTLTAPSGWTQVLEQAGTGVTLRVYRKTASSEGSSYTWSLSTTDGLAVAIGAYYNVDTTTPVGGSGSQANSSSTSMVAPSVTPGTPADMLLFCGAAAGDVRATAPGSMTEEADAGAAGVGVYAADQLLASSDATGTRTATLASATANAAALVSLRPTSTGGGAAATTIYVSHNNLNSGDRVIMEARLQVEFMAVTSSYTEVTAGEEYSYTVTRDLDGTGANDWVAGDAVVNEGQAGNGWIELYARYGQPHAGQTATQRVGPTIVGNVRKSSTFNDFRERWAIGNLNGLYDFSTSVYGFAAGDPTQTWISIDDRAAGSGGGLRFMNNLATVAYIRNDGTWRFSGDANNYIAWNGSTLTVAGTVVISGSFSGINYAGASTPGGAATNLVNQGALATANSADWATQVASRPTELTDGRIATAIAAGGLVQSRVDPGVNWGSNPGAGYAGLLLGADYMGYWTGSAWKSYLDSSGRFYLNAGAGSNFLAWDGSTLTVSGTITVVGGNAAKVDFTNITATLDAIPNGSTYGRVSTTIIAGGLIQVGSGTKDSSLSGWHISSTEIVGQASGVDQVVLNTSGKIVAGAGSVYVDADGVSLQAGSSAYAFVNWYRTVSTKSNELGRIQVFESGGIDYMDIDSRGSATSTGVVRLLAEDSERLRAAPSAVTVTTPTFNVNGSGAANTDVLGSWSNLSFGTGWGNYGGGYAAGQYRRFGDIIMVRGLVALSSGTNATIGTLPSGYRPTNGQLVLTLYASTGAIRVDVTTGGAINVVGGATTGMWVGINFAFSLS